MRLGALEAGGTKMVCAIGDENGTIFEKAEIPTRTPRETVPDLIGFYREGGISALGIGCFGPVELDRASPNYGFITTTPKLAWRNFDMVGTFSRALGCPVGFDTDVNSSVLGEAAFGQAKGKRSVVYLTVGTGIGGGVWLEGRLLHGMLHPELGHVPLSRRPGDAYAGCCPYHKNCLEGLASGPAIEGRWGAKAAQLADRPEVWELEADYLAQAVTGYILTLSPEMVILGGGVLRQTQLFPLIRSRVAELLGGYLQTAELADMEHYIVPASLHGDQGILGCLELARREAEGP